MRFAYYIKKRALREDSGIMSVLDGLRAAGSDVYNIVEGLREGTDMLLSFGGDGTFLSAARLVAEAGVPVLGINLGRLGFLSEYKLDEFSSAVLKGEYTIENREMLKVEVEGGNPSGFWPYALNEVSVHRSGAAMLGVDVSLDGKEAPTYWADGLLVSTSSGSTAYSLSVGGPICMPDVDAFIIAPIAPHNLNVRPLVVGSRTSICVSMRSRSDRSVLLSLDNSDFEVPVGTRLNISAAPFPLRWVRLSESNFIDALRSKLFWGEDVRNLL